MPKLRITGWLALLAASGCTAGLNGITNHDAPALVPAAQSGPANASYLIEGSAITLTRGKAERQAAPASAEKVETTLIGMPVPGDLDGDGDDDAAVILLHRTGGTGSFYYVAATIRQGDVFRGTNAIRLGDRVAPKSVQIRNGVLTAHYDDRRVGESMAVVPSIAQSKYITLQAGKLVEARPLAEGVELREGWVTIGHEARTFQPCGQGEGLWLDPRSEAFKAVGHAYAQALPENAQPYTPVFMTLAGRFEKAPSEGTGRDYSASFLATQWLQAWPRGNCRADRIRVDTPLAGSVIRSPLRVSGSARGFWFFEADFPVHLKDENGRIVATGIAKAQAPWMTEAFVPFEATLEFKSSPQPMRGALVLVKDNPSDDRSLDEAVELPVFYQ